MMLLGLRSQLQVLALFLAMFVTAVMYHPLAGLLDWLFHQSTTTTTTRTANP